MAILDTKMAILDAKMAILDPKMVILDARDDNNGIFPKTTFRGLKSEFLC